MGDYNEIARFLPPSPKAKMYFFRSPGQGRGKRMEKMDLPNFLREPSPPKVKVRKKRESKSTAPNSMVASGDIQISRRRAEFEESMAPRLENIEKEYQANKNQQQVKINPK